MRGVILEDRAQVASALDLARSGMDLADALHLVAAPEHVSFATFDGPLAKAAKRTEAPRSVRRL